MKPPPDPLLAPLAALPDRLLVGVSGGRDSCALLHALVAAGRRPLALHFDHGWRKTGAEETRFVRALAKEYSLAYASGKAPAGTPRTESEARRRRWAFFARAAGKSGYSDLVLAHHADDQVETFLLQLLRGAGSAWRGMAPVAAQGSLTVHRPWLGVWRSEIEAYAARHRLAWRDDPTNLAPAPLRSRLRHRLLPLLETEFEPSVRGRLLRAAEIQRGTQEWLDALVSAQARLPRLPVRETAALPLGHQRHLLRAWLQAQGATDLSFDDIEAARALLTRLRPARINLARGRHLRRRAGFLFLA